MRKMLALAAALTLAAGTPLAAQNLGLPVDNSGVGGGLTLAATVGFPNEDAGKGTAFGLTGKLGLGPLGVTATASTWNPDAFSDKVNSIGGTANLKIFGGPLIPLSVTLQGGGAFASVNGTDLVHVPVGVGFALRIPNPAISIKPWVAPRLDYVKASGNGNDSDETNFGFSAGVDLNLLSGLGFHAAYDYVKADNDLTPSIFSVGAHYALRIPGL